VKQPPGRQLEIAGACPARTSNGFQNRHHERRDALLEEDDRRSRKAPLLANLALLRNVLLDVLTVALGEQSLPQLREQLHSNPARPLTFLASSGTQNKRRCPGDQCCGHRQRRGNRGHQPVWEGEVSGERVREKLSAGPAEG
jgi:hypothetical protein